MYLTGVHSGAVRNMRRIIQIFHYVKREFVRRVCVHVVTGDYRCYSLVLQHTRVIGQRFTIPAKRGQAITQQGKAAQVIITLRGKTEHTNAVLAYPFMD